MLTIFEPGGTFPAEFPKGALLLVDKPVGWTSFDVVNKIRIGFSRRLGVKRIKIGHAGTLDPLATGLLILCLGEYTKRIESFQDMEKEYTGTITFGATTASYDLEKPPENPAPTAHLNDALLAGLLDKFRGDIQQVPPMFSAIKVDGKRVYKNARTGQVQELEPRTVQMHAFELWPLHPVQPSDASAAPINEKGAPIWLYPDYPDGLQADFRVLCGKGTYIRSLAYDLGQEAGCGAYLSRLRRTKTGGFSVDNAWQMEELIPWIKG
ncbi:MAG: tRNA pseudouridine(55) synthase TruB [Lewinellaceae bacterium]|nr:tRNA pseudouridine(55) synthase TruB [Lewinellaceae bacterium]